MKKTKNDKTKTLVSTAHQQRLPLFCKKTKFETAYGKIELSRELTQTHKDILDSMMVCAVHKGKTLDGRIIVVFDMQEILKFLGHKQTNNHKWIIEKLHDLMTTVIKLEFRKDNTVYKIHSTIVNKFGYSKKYKKENIKKGTFGDGCLFAVVFSEEYSKIYEQDIILYLNKETVKAIVDISKEFTKTVVRFCLTHKQCNMKFDDILYYLGYENISDRHKRRLKEELLNHKEYLCKNFNIALKQNENDLTIFYPASA